jgi:PPP family 3-phenylpropionic acid transporter
MQFYHGISYGLGGFVGSILAGYFYGKYLFLVAALIAASAFFILSISQGNPFLSRFKKLFIR